MNKQIYRQILYKQHTKYHSKNIIPHQQYGFVEEKFAVTDRIECICKAMDGTMNYKHFDVIYLDVSKAFDSVEVPLFFS